MEVGNSGQNYNLGNSYKVLDLDVLANPDYRYVKKKVWSDMSALNNAIKEQYLKFLT